METAYIIKGELIDHTTIKLNEPVPFDDKNVTVVIEVKKDNKLDRSNLFGKWKNKIKISDDFSDLLSDFKEYME